MIQNAGNRVKVFAHEIQKRHPRTQKPDELRSMEHRQLLIYYSILILKISDQDQS